jgi:hypothetical protein
VPPKGPARQYRCGEPWSLLVEHDGDGGPRTLIHASAGYRPGALMGVEADVVYLGIGQLGRPFGQLRKVRKVYLRAYWAETVGAVKASRVVLIHWDDLFRSLDRDLVALPYLADNLDVTMETLEDLASEDRVDLFFPKVWERHNPWPVRTG